MGSRGILVCERFLDEATLAAVRQAMAADRGEVTRVRALDGDELIEDRSARVAWEVTLQDPLIESIVDRIEALRPELEGAHSLTLEPCDAVAALRYPVGAFYGPHRDVADAPHADDLHRRAVSIVIFVNDGAGPHAEFGGGHLRFHGPDDREDEVRDVVPEAGTLVAFPSGLRHEVTPVTWGERYVVVTWLLGAEPT